ncbi:hypothetical protein ONS95_008728 [Cadophora gregata]|uniref:uncharacterized protein n=1 Tax=Cadophora gregata TaxID=51156 RepID=UPI0026DBAF69|nr:uncharacterized protein ONS95_008728 [Cadophora gregata]KAK0123719.1 hypothetical protein ONS95_008728 [Cadophora gregata]
MSNTADTVLDAATMLSSTQDETSQGQMHCRIVWQASIPNHNADEVAVRKLHFDPHDLSILLHRTYHAMFEHEDTMKAISTLSIMTIRNNSCPMYHRGSFAALLKFLKPRVVTHWEKMMEMLILRIANDQTIMIGFNSIQDFFAHLSLLDIHNASGITAGCMPSDAARFKEGLGSWNTLPPVVCVTLEVPRSKLHVLKETPRNQRGTSNVQCCVQEDVNSHFINGRQEIFSDVQLTFGRLSTGGEVSDEEVKVMIQEDSLGWAGTSPLIVSFNVPTWVVLREPSKTIITFGLQSAPQNVAIFSKSLGTMMFVFAARLMDSNNVHITRFRPCQSGHASIAKLGLEFGNEDSDQDVRTTVTVNLDSKSASLSGLTGRIDFLSNEVKSLLLGGASVVLTQISPSTISVGLGNDGKSFTLNFPIPVLSSHSKTRIARKSSYIEVSVPSADHVSGRGFPHFMYPICSGRDAPILSNLPYLHPSTHTIHSPGFNATSVHQPPH